MCYLVLLDLSQINVSLSNEPCINRPTLINANAVALNAVDDLSTKIYVPSKTKGINVKVFNMITRINEDKALIKHISCD